MKKLSTDSYKGVRDFYPDDMFALDYIQAVWSGVLQSFGYEHYSASILEPAELYEGKTSDEIVSEQTYTFMDRGDRRVTLRPEMTPSVARMVARKRQELSFPLRWYSIPNVFRYERPQKGRLREHWQLNADLFGLPSLDAEAEMIEISSAIMKQFRLTESDFVIRISDREILRNVVSKLGLPAEKVKPFMKLLDKKDKLQNFNEEMEMLIGRPFNDTIVPNSNVQELLDKLSKRGISNVVFDPLVVRGFDYYTGIIFEIFDTSAENPRSLFGGGRYDNLLEIFGVEKIPTVGFGMGDVTIRDALSSRGLLPSGVAPAHIAICTTGPEAFDYASNLASEIRSVGADVVVNYSNRKLGDQISRASKKGIPYVICIGNEEVKSDKFKIKALVSGAETAISRNNISSFVRNTLLAGKY